MPTSGGLYYAAAVLAPPGWGPFAAWVTGWSNWLAQVSTTENPSPALMHVTDRYRLPVLHLSTTHYQQ